MIDEKKILSELERVKPINWRWMQRQLLEAPRIPFIYCADCDLGRNDICLRSAESIEPGGFCSRGVPRVDPERPTFKTEYADWAYTGSVFSSKSYEDESEYDNADS